MTNCEPPDNGFDPMDLDVVALLASGGDSRLALSADDRSNKYGCRYEPETDLLALGSCTGSTISRRAFDAVRVFRAAMPSDVAERRIWAEEQGASIRRRLAGHFLGRDATAVDILLTPSGTDAEFVPLILAGVAFDRRITNIVVAPTEVGSGTSSAAAGEHFDADRPNALEAATADPFEGRPIELVTVPIRDAAGTVRAAEAIDASIVGAVETALSESDDVIVHVVAHSKTGVHAPSLSTVDRLQRRHGDRLHVVIDAAQGRISRRGMREALARQRIVILTGSKFYGGPPFSGAVFVPDRYRDVIRNASMPACSLSEYFTACEAPEDLVTWRASVSPIPNVGLLLRWLAALAEIDDYYATLPSIRYRVLRSFERLCSSQLGGTPSILLEDSVAPVLDDAEERLLESKQTVFSFKLAGPDGRTLDADRLRCVRASLRDGSAVTANERCIAAVEIGQPVALSAGGDAVLRVALGAPSMRRWACEPDIEAAIAADLEVVVVAIERAIGQRVLAGADGG